MKIIKFRALCTEEFHTSHDCIEKGHWCYGIPVLGDEKMQVAMQQESGGICSGIVTAYVSIDPKTIGEFTGLFDKKGVEIYEFDIVAIDNEENPVITKCIYEPGYFTLLDSAGGSWTRQLFHQQERLEVVGNRFENPELL